MEPKAGGELQETALLNLLEGLPAAEQPRLVARLLGEVERLHRERGVAVPDWVGQLRERYTSDDD
ncbi:MAG TPA: hypothetical protein VEW03_16405 [Longimicrobiaceae bacterium]|nr:hypothetical protein [Longimicrobiaceae bacterium]